MSTAFVTSRRVEFSDTDAAGIVHFVAFFRMMEQAEHELLRSVGLSEQAFPHPHGRGDEVTSGSGGDSRDGPSMGRKSREASIQVRIVE